MGHTLELASCIRQGAWEELGLRLFFWPLPRLVRTAHDATHSYDACLPAWYPAWYPAMLADAHLAWQETAGVIANVRMASAMCSSSPSTAHGAYHRCHAQAVLPALLQ